MKKITALFLALLPTLFLTSCFEGDGGDDKEPFQAIITLSTEAIGPGGESITVDASSSTGVTSSAVYVWDISGASGTVTYGGNTTELNQSSSSINFTTSDPSFEFTSVGAGEYFLNLRIEQGGQFSNGSASFSVAGSIVLTTVPGGYEFIDINASSDIPDYIFEADVTLSNVNFNMSNGSDFVFEVADGSQMIFDNSISYSGGGSTLLLTVGSPEGTTWKGAYIKSTASFSAQYNYFTLNNAGSAAIETYEPAAIIFETVPSGVNLTTANCQGYDVAFGNGVSSLSGSGFNLEGDGQGIYAPLSVWPDISYFYKPITLEGGLDTQVSFSSSSIYVYSDVYIKGGASISSYLTIQGSQITGESRYPNIYVEEDGALIFGGGVNMQSLNMMAEEEAAWRGVYVAGSGSYFSGVTITNAGSAAISSTSISTSEKAALYVADDLYRFSGSSILGSGGYGIYTTALLAPTASKTYYNNNTFENTTEAAIRLPQEYGAFFSGVNNSFSLNEGIAAVEVFQTSNNIYAGIEWEDLGASNFYHFTGNLNVSNTQMIIAEGANFKFDEGKGLYFSGTSSGHKLTITGTSDSPVTMGAAETSWAGIFIGGIGSTCSFVADYLTVDAGGGITMTGATEAANLVVDTDLNTPSVVQFNITNSTFSNSSGYGAVIEPENGFSFDLTGASLSNTFSGNTSGTFIDKTLP